MRTTITFLVLFAAVVAGAALLLPTVEAESSYYDWGQWYYPQYQYDYGYGYGYGYDYGYTYPYTNYGYGGGYSQYYSPYSPVFYNATFVNPRFVDADDFDDNRRRPDVDLRADDTSINEGESTRLRLDVDNADDCEASNSRNDRDFRGDVDEDGGTERVRPDRTTTYRITCSNRYGTSSDSVTVFVDEDDDIRVDLRADDTRIDEGDSTRLRWDVDGDADRCFASNDENDRDFEGNVDEDDGSVRVDPDETTTYTLTCWNNTDQDTDSVTIRVD